MMGDHPLRVLLSILWPTNRRLSYRGQKPPDVFRGLSSGYALDGTNVPAYQEAAHCCCGLLELPSMEEKTEGCMKLDEGEY